MEANRTAALPCLAGELPEEAPFWDRDVTLGLVVNGKLLGSHRIGEKEMLIARSADASEVFATWHGGHYSELFTVSRERLERERSKRAAAKPRRK